MRITKLSVFFFAYYYIISILKKCASWLMATTTVAPRDSTTFWPLWWCISLSIRVQTTLHHIRFVKSTINIILKIVIQFVIVLVFIFKQARNKNSRNMNSAANVYSNNFFFAVIPSLRLQWIPSTEYPAFIAYNSATQSHLLSKRRSND